MNGFVKTPIGNLYATADKTATLTDEVLYGWPLEILSQKGDYYYVNTFYNYKGFIECTDVELKKNKPTDIITQSFADIQTGETVQHRTILTLIKGSYISVEVKGDKYAKINLINGHGFTRNKFLKKYKPPSFSCSHDYQNKEDLRYQILENACSYMGTQYRWGGKTHYGIDCSGLTFMAYFLSGIIIYRDASIKAGFPVKKIEKDKLKIADLIYFKGHIGMYMGDDKFIHSSDNNGGVGIDKLSEKLSSNSSYEFIGFGSIFN